MKWLKNLFKKKTEPEAWQWQCLHQDCTVKGVGTEDEVREDSMYHLMTSGHTVMGGVQE